MPTIRELRSELRALGLATTVRRAALEQRLKAARETSPTPDSPATPDDHCDTIVAARIEIDDPTLIVKHAEDVLKRCANKHQLQFAMINDNPVVTNARAFPYAEAKFERGNLEGRLSGVESRLQETECRLKEAESCLKDTKLSLSRRISDLEESVSDIKDARNRFMSSFKRDVLSNDNEADRQIIKIGNRVVHGGDSKRDAELYEAPARRRDFDIYIRLYGLHPAIIRASVSYRPTIELLDRHATAVADKKTNYPVEFHSRFEAFIKVLKDSNFDEDYLDHPTSPVAMAYWAFLRHCPV